MKAGLSQNAIENIIGVHKPTMSREILRNRGLRGYSPKQAHQFVKARRTKAARPRISFETWSQIEQLQKVT